VIAAARRVLPAGLAITCGTGAVALAAAGAIALGDYEFFLALVGIAAGVAVVYIALRVEPAWPISVGIALAVFSGQSDRLGFPVGPDRILIAAGLAGVMVQGYRQDADGRALRPPIPVRSAHWVLFVSLLWAAGSAYWAGTLTESSGFFALLDRLGLVPFVLFFVAPVAFRTAAQRRILLGVLVITGAYLGLTALFETLNLNGLVFPKYILDPSVGIHADRARGPFVQAVANGLGLFIGATAGLLGTIQWRRRAWRRTGCLLVAAVCAVGMLFTLTRAVWVGAVVAAVCVVLVTPRLWRWLPAGALAATALVATALLLVPGLDSRVQERKSAESPVWVRENTDAAALRIVASKPLFGIGWERFKTDSAPWFRQPDDIPMDGLGAGVHNVFLANATELGLPGAFLWLAGAALAIGGALVRRAPPELRPWRAGLLALTVMTIVVGSFGPLPYAFPLLVLWTLAGVLMASTRYGGSAGAPEGGATGSS
jgi:putative inorganic carbon (HCO3(-)) transporter